MKFLGIAITGLVLAATPVVAQPAMSTQEQASAPATAASEDMLSALRNSRQIADQIATLGPVPAHKVEIRNAQQLSQGAQPGQFDQAFNDNKQAVQDLRKALIRNKSVDRALSRDQIPITDVVAANVEPDGRIVVYAFPQTAGAPQTGERP